MTKTCTAGVTCLLVALLAVGAAWAQATEGSTEVGFSSATIVVELPPGTAGGVSVSQGDQRILLEMPRGAVFPLDLASSSGGLLAGGEIVPMGKDRIRLEMKLGRGLLDRIDYGSDRVVLFFVSRFERSGTDADDKYRLGINDRLQLTVHDQPDMDKRLTVTRDGTVSVPLVGDVTAEGMTPRELASRVTELLEEKYLVDPQVDVEVEEYRSQWVMISGEIRKAGRVPLKGGTRLKEVLSEGGGFDREAGEEIMLSRSDATGDNFEVQKIDRRDFEAGEVNPVLQHGDIIEVPRALYCYVQGEVRKPGAVKIERNMSLLKAIALAAGLTEWADKKDVQVIYGSEADAPIRNFNIKKIRSGKQQDPPLKGGEVIIVNRRFF